MFWCVLPGFCLTESDLKDFLGNVVEFFHFEHTQAWDEKQLWTIVLTKKKRQPNTTTEAGFNNQIFSRENPASKIVYKKTKYTQTKRFFKHNKQFF